MPLEAQNYWEEELLKTRNANQSIKILEIAKIIILYTKLMRLQCNRHASNIAQIEQFIQALIKRIKHKFGPPKTWPELCLS